jgi:Cu-processing system permease protein
VDGKSVIMLKVLKFETKNILRSRWIFGYIAVASLLSGGLSYLTAESNKVLVSLALIMPVLVPLVCLAYSTLHWYYNERFTVLLLTQPISRQTVLLSRYLALALTLSFSVIVGVIFPFVVRLQWPSGLGLLLLNIVLLTFIFVGLALWIAAVVSDRLKGIGMALGAWVYLSMLHDGLLLVLLIIFRESPMDLPAGVFSGFNPISLSRVVQLMYFDQALLLGHTGALTKQILVSWRGYALATGAGLFWIIVPLFGTLWSFRRKDL